ncbi:unnamed protein product [Ixodes pacificus]
MYLIIFAAPTSTLCMPLYTKMVPSHHPDDSPQLNLRNGHCDENGPSVAYLIAGAKETDLQACCLLVHLGHKRKKLY